MSPTRSRAKMKENELVSTSATHTSDPSQPLSSPQETIVTAPLTNSTPSTSPTFPGGSKAQPRRVLRLKCPLCNDYPDGFRSEHELRRHTNRVHRKARKVWVTIDTSPDKTFLANCKACQTGKKYNECYNAASHLRRMHFHPHKRGERKMTAAEARRGGKPGDLDPPMDVLKASWLREVDEFQGDLDGPAMGQMNSMSMIQTHHHALQQPSPTKTEAKAPPTPTTPSTRSMAIDSIVDKVNAS